MSNLSLLTCVILSIHSSSVVPAIWPKWSITIVVATGLIVVTKSIAITTINVAISVVVSIASSRELSIGYICMVYEDIW